MAEFSERPDATPFPDGDAIVGHVNSSYPLSGATVERIEADLNAAAPKLTRDEERRLLEHLQGQLEPPYIRRLLDDPTDAGLANFVAHMTEDRIAFDYVRERWLIFEPPAWNVDDDGTVPALVEGAIRSLLEQKHSQLDKLVARAHRALRRSGFTAALAFLQHKSPAPRTKFDSDPDLLAVANGAVDLRSGDLREAEAADWFTRWTPVRFDPQAQAPRWLAFLERVFDHDADLIAFVQRAIGYTLTAHTREHAFFVCYGSGANGKSTLMRVLSKLLGTYAIAADAETFYLSRAERANRDDLARMDGARAVIASEGQENRKIDSSQLKSLTGGDRITASFKYGHPFEFDMRAKIWFATNYLPRVDDDSPAMWRRVKLIPFAVQIPVAERDPDLVDHLTAELPGILAWAVAGARAWYDRGLAAPTAVAKATDAYRADEDDLGDFLRECCDLKPNVRETAAALFAAFAAFKAENGEPVGLTQKAFGLRLDRLGFTAEKTRLTRYRRGIQLRVRDAFDGSATHFDALSSVGKISTSKGVIQNRVATRRNASHASRDAHGKVCGSCGKLALVDEATGFCDPCAEKVLDA